jgi:hypothetical protein
VIGILVAVGHDNIDDDQPCSGMKRDAGLRRLLGLRGCKRSASEGNNEVPGTQRTHHSLSGKTIYFNPREVAMLRHEFFARAL